MLGALAQRRVATELKPPHDLFWSSLFLVALLVGLLSPRILHAMSGIAPSIAGFPRGVPTPLAPRVVVLGTKAVLALSLNKTNIMAWYALL